SGSLGNYSSHSYTTEADVQLDNRSEAERGQVAAFSGQPVYMLDEFGDYDFLNPDILTMATFVPQASDGGGNHGTQDGSEGGENTPSNISRSRKSLMRSIGLE
ncbi:hypothetical protein ACQZV8_21045, partial [Magnetococcales bacterium HHB-1]